MNRCLSLASLTVAVSVLTAPMAVAQEPGGGTVALMVDVEQFRWTQNGAASGAANWEDDGPRGSVGIAWSNLRVPTGGPVYRAFGRLYGGKVDSEIASAPPVATETEYLGFQAEGIGGYRFGGRVGFELVSGIGIDVWHRNILDDAIDSQLWAVLNAKLGVGFFTRFDYFGLAVRAGPKLPLVAWERAYIGDNVDLAPKPRLSWFAQAEFNFGVRGKDNVTIAAYYDSYNFETSDYEPLYVNGVYSGFVIAQPETEMQVIGARLSIGF